MDTLSLDVDTKLAYEHILSVLVGICKVCKNIPVVMDYVSENLIKIFKDADCSWVVEKRDLVTDKKLTWKVQRCAKWHTKSWDRR